MNKYRFYFLLLLTLLLKSCEVPDVQPFIKATSEMGTSIEAGLKQVVTDLKEVTIPNASLNSTAEQQQEVKDRQHELATDITHLEAYTKSFTNVAHAFDDYAKALDDVVASGKKRGDQVEKVAKTLLDLAGAVKAYTGPIGVVAEPAIKLLDMAIKDLGDVHTINKLNQLTSPKQDTLVQRTARVLRLGLHEFGRIDKDAFKLVKNYKPREDADIESIHQNSINTQKAAISGLKLIKLLENNILANKKGDLETNLGVLVAKDKLLDKDNLLEPKLKAVTADIKATGSVQDSTKAALFDALKQRKKFYTEWLLEPETTRGLYEVEQARYVQNLDVVDKSQKAIIAWAKAHHALRAEILKSKKVKTADFIRYGEASQKIYDAVKGLKKN